jgi:hypothetical protein
MRGTLSSGEGLAYAVRDATSEEDDPGIEDKRLFAVQGEFGSVLKVMRREGNSLSGALRDAWDGNSLAPMTKNNLVRATDPHIGIVGHVTKDELLRNLTGTEMVNGFGNRFCWFLVRRSKELPFSSAPVEADRLALVARIGQALRVARGFEELRLTEAAKHIWAGIYSYLSRDQAGMAGALLGRAEAQVMRIAAIYACLDGVAAIDAIHLEAAFALWDHAEASTKSIFGESLGDPIADKILKALDAGDLSDSEISTLFERHVPASKLEVAKALLVTAGLAHPVVYESGGRPRTMWCRGAQKAN